MYPVLMLRIYLYFVDKFAMAMSYDVENHNRKEILNYANLNMCRFLNCLYIFFVPNYFKQNKDIFFI